MLFVAIGCGDRSVPTSPAIESRAGTASATTSSAPVLFGPSAVDFARCLQGAADAACVSGPRLGIHTVVGGAATAPSSPLNLSTSAIGNSVMLTWNAPLSGDPVTTYVIEAGSAPGLANLANVTTNSTSTSFSASGVGAGTYYVRIRAQNAGGTSAPSNESTLVVGSAGCTSAPNAPTAFTISASGSTVTLTWTAPVGGCAPTSYVLQAGSATGQSNIANSNVGPATSYVATGVGGGTYYVRVRAVNAYGQSAASNEVVVTVVPPGLWTYVIIADVPLGGPQVPSCRPPNAPGTAVVSSSGSFSIPFSGLACSSCAMSGTITGTITQSGVSGSVTASISGSGCSGQQPTPSPAPMVGSCTATGCSVGLSGPGSFAISYTLTPLF